MVDHKKFADKRTTLMWVDPRKISVKQGLNARDLSTPDNKAHVRWIADSIKANGFRQSNPLEVAEIDGVMCITQGHCRLAAVMTCIEEGFDIVAVPYIPEPPGTSPEDRIANQYNDNAGKALTPLELSGNVKRLLGMGMDVDQIAKRFAISGTYVDSLLRLQAAPIEVHNMVKHGEVSAGTAMKVLQEEGATGGAQVLREAVKVAKAAGKTRATMKHVNARAQASDDAKSFRIAWKAKAGLLSVRIGRTDFQFTPERWLEMAEKIAKDARGIIDGEQPPQPIKHAPAEVSASV